ncbi:MAG: cellulase family glycosylhydrolase, partial [Paludibacteraceae bacterium]|nr:cellulase family glycosylhydrolase [Paludibacteraceae bacterium]
WSTSSLHTGGVQGCLGKSQFELMKSYGANIVRLAMHIDDESDGGSYLANKKLYKQKVKDYIDDAYEAGMYVLVDWHTIETNGKEGNPWNQREDSKDFFSEISSYAKSKGYNHVLYELCNEPKCEDWATVKKYAEYVIPSIVENQPDAMIIAGTNNWCQNILEPVSNPIDSVYKKNVLYSFHYYACSHYSLLGDFRAAQGMIPVFVSEWSAVKFDGEGPFCKQNSDDFMYACGIGNTKQLVSWCVWNWGKKDDATSFFTGTCDAQSLSQYRADDGQTLYGEYVSNLMSGLRCCPPPPLPCCGSYEEPNRIPTEDYYAWHWDAFNYGGEGIAYHDANSSAWKKDADGTVLDYNWSGDEVDVFSLAYQMQWIDKKCPWSTVENGRVVSWNDSISTIWKDVNNDDKPTYKSLNGGRMYSGTAGSRRPDEGVDMVGASLRGTSYQHSGYQSIEYVEDGEWINYTVKVEKPGYYKIRGIVSAGYTAPNEEGEISITSGGENILRDTSALDDADVITTFGFQRVTDCADPSAESHDSWDCWAEVDAISGDHDAVLCLFKEAGEQEITISFSGSANGVGPLLFDFYKELSPEDPYTCGDCGGVLPEGPWSTLNTIPSNSSAWRWDYYDVGGEGVSYHDKNSSAWKKDKEGVIIDYSNDGDEVDVYSLAKEYEWLNKKCPWSTVKNGKVVAWDKSIDSYWTDDNGKPTYRSLNGGRRYSGTDGTVRPDGGVDMVAATCRGTAYASLGYNTIEWVEEGEWINYTVNVEKPGYYKIRGVVSAGYKGVSDKGEISIVSQNGNLLRDASALDDENAITSFGFPVTDVCDDPKVDAVTEPWDCWTVSDARSGKYNEVLCEFKNAGVQQIKIMFNDNASGIGPLLFDFYKELSPEDPFACCGGSIPTAVNTISSTKASLWHWDYYNNGGEGVAYHDLNSGAYEKDADGVIIGYSNKSDEVDVFSLAKEMKWLRDTCPWSTVKNGKVVAWDKSIDTEWKDVNGKFSYRSLNGGRRYFGNDGSIRPDEGVDLLGASLNGTAYEGEPYSSLGWVEEGEWINYTVKVEKPGYYKISGIIGAEYTSPEDKGEISIVSGGKNLLRIPERITDPDTITSFGFPRTLKCDDSKIKLSEPWYCWTVADARSYRSDEVLCLFPEAGEQTITISFNENAGGVGPLIFEFYKELEPKDPFVCGDCGGDFPGAVNDVDAANFSINPNPTSGEFTLTLVDNVEASVEVVNMAGQVVVSQKIVGSATINKSLTAGVYTVIVKTNAGVSTQKLVVK